MCSYTGLQDLLFDLQASVYYDFAMATHFFDKAAKNNTG